MVFRQSVSRILFPMGGEPFLLRSLTDSIRLPHIMDNSLLSPVFVDKKANLSFKTFSCLE